MWRIVICRAAQIPGARLPWRLMSVGRQYGTGFMSSFWQDSCHLQTALTAPNSLRHKPPFVRQELKWLLNYDFKLLWKFNADTYPSLGGNTTFAYTLRRNMLDPPPPAVSVKVYTLSVGG
jgi:hypothetical protein